MQHFMLQGATQALPMLLPLVHRLSQPHRPPHCRPARHRAPTPVPLSALPPVHACRLRGRTVEQDTAEALAELPAEKQMRIAAGFRDFSERIA